MMKLFCLIFLLLTLLVTMEGYGQSSSNKPQTFRVVAVSQANQEVTSISNELDLYFPLAVQIPTAFTPNGDGLNDTFGPVGEGIEIFKMTVFNRWGNIIFSSNDPALHWDGNHNGNPVPFGSYNYEIFAEGKEIGKIHRMGQVMVAK